MTDHRDPDGVAAFRGCLWGLALTAAAVLLTVAGLAAAQLAR